MLVGRATKGDFELDSFVAHASVSAQSSLYERKMLNRRLVNTKLNSSPFWRAFAKGSSVYGPSEGFENAVWSNLAKIGFAKRDVDNRSFSKQADLSERTLVAEFEDFRPSLVHFAVGRLGSPCILRATKSKEADWERMDGDLNDIWWLQTAERKMIWTRHPNRAVPSIVNAWNRKLEELASN